MGNWFSDFFEETGEFLSENAGGILTTASTLAGLPVGQANTLKILGLAAGALGKKGSSTADKTNALIQSGIDAQTAYQLAALDEVKAAGQRSTAIATADKQMAMTLTGPVRLQPAEYPALSDGFCSVHFRHSLSSSSSWVSMPMPSPPQSVHTPHHR